MCVGFKAAITRVCSQSDSCAHVQESSSSRADIKVIFVAEPDDIINPLGIKGLGEIGIVGVAAAIANAVYRATGKRVRDLPITLDKVLG